MRPGVVSLPHGWGHGQPGTRLRVAAERAGVNSNVLADHEALDPLQRHVGAERHPGGGRRPCEACGLRCATACGYVDKPCLVHVLRTLVVHPSSTPGAHRKFTRLYPFLPTGESPLRCPRQLATVQGADGRHRVPSRVRPATVRRGAVSWGRGLRTCALAPSSTSTCGHAHGLRVREHRRLVIDMGVTTVL